MESKLKKCEICQIDSTCLCFKCMSYFCDICFKSAHSNEERKYHKKDKIDNFAPIDIKCKSHKLYPMDLYCVNEKGK